jgi:pimeloyl-ACP methyl ester carboxylesterase
MKNEPDEPDSKKNHRRLATTAIVLVALGLLLAVTGIALVYWTTFPDVTIKRVGFSTGEYESPPRTVSGLLVEPAEPEDEASIGLVFSHGLFMNKELHLEQSRALAKQGMTVLDIDLRGHGETGGANDAGLTEKRDVWAAVDYLSGVESVDHEKIAVAGHSMGSIASTTAGIFQRSDSIKTVCGIAGQPGRKKAARLLFGDIEVFIGKLWRFSGYSRTWDVSGDFDLERREVIGYIDEENPPNYLLVVGERDAALPVERAEEIMREATGRDIVVPGETYGNFTDRTARRLVVTDDTHTSEVYSREVWAEISRWVFESFDTLPEREIQINPGLRYRGQALVVLGLLLVGFGALYLLRHRTRENNPVDDIRPYVPLKKKPAARLAVLSGVLLAAASLAAFPFASATGIRGFIPLLGADVYTSWAAARTILLIPCVALVVLSTRLEFMKAEFVVDRSGYRRGGVSRSLAAGFTPLAVFIILYFPISRGMFLSGGSPVCAWASVALASVVTVQLVAEQQYIYYLVLPALGRLDSAGKRVAYILGEALLRGICFGISFVVLAGPLYAVGRPDRIRFPLVPAMCLVGFLLFLPASAICLYAKRRGYSVLGPALFLGLASAVFLGSMFAVRVF